MRRRISRLAVLGWIALIPLSVAADPAPETANGPPAIQEPSASATSGATPAGNGASTGTATSSDAVPSEKTINESEKAAAAAPPPPPPQPTLLININLTTQRMVVTEGGKPKYTWAISSGAYGYPTPTGTFTPSWMSKMWYSKQYDNAPMPHSIFFKGGAAIHATSSIHLLGTPASHGCVRLAPSNAAKLYAMVSRHGKDRTQISVHGRPKYTAPQIARARPGSAPSMRYAYSHGNYGYAPPRYVYPGDAPRYYIQSSKQRAAALKKRRAAVRQYYSPY
ncbi:MAG: L,D-transpeptidase [Hyphomicrobium sp.]|nr:L,D-transpeptidase [Hyphomicrobium sp.]